MKKENITKIVVVFLLVCIASVLLHFGFYLKNVSKPNYVFSSLIDSIDLLKDKYFSFDSKYLVGDNFSIDGNVSFEMSSEKYGISSDPSILSKYYMINNLNNTTINYKLMQDIKNKKIYSEVKTNIGTQNVLYNKLLVENATKYYFINSVYSNYINGGSCNYFESLTEENTTKDNIDYLYNFILKSLKNNLKEEDVLDQYDMVIHLVTVATNNENKYNNSTNSARFEDDIEEVIDLDKKTNEAWSKHKNLKRVEATDIIDEKIDKVIKLIHEYLNIK